MQRSLAEYQLGEAGAGLAVRPRPYRPGVCIVPGMSSRPTPQSSPADAAEHKSPADDVETKDITADEAKPTGGDEDKAADVVEVIDEVQVESAAVEPLDPHSPPLGMQVVKLASHFEGRNPGDEILVNHETAARLRAGGRIARD